VCSSDLVPLSDKIVTPAWASKVSHDLPFREGLSGELQLTLIAKSPLLVGGQQTQNADGSTTVHFYRTPDNEYAIPGSSLKGMIRAVLEIVTFSRMSMVEDKRYGLRDISTRHVKEAYGQRIRNSQLQTGFLALDENGAPQITPCDMARFSHRDLEKWWSIEKPVFPKRTREKEKQASEKEKQTSVKEKQASEKEKQASEKEKQTSVKEKYDVWQQHCHEHNITDPFLLPVTISSQKVTAIGKGSLMAFPVLTGQISDCTDDKYNRQTNKKSRGKYHDFMFHSPRSAEAFSVHEIDPAAWRDFLFIHGDEEIGSDMPWPGFWKQRYYAGNQVPVFYIKAENRLQIGLASMPKLAGDFSIHDMIGHTSEDHLDANRADFATLLFGSPGDESGAGQRGRVQFDMAHLQGSSVGEQTPPACVLSSPKPTYFPNYITQHAVPGQWQLKGENNAQYATYLDTQHACKPELRGWKRYPARPKSGVKIQGPIGPDQQKNKKIQIHLRPLPPKTQFNTRIRFHNLLPEELGALVWCLEWGKHDQARHSLGMGKSFGYGQISLRIDRDNSRLYPNTNSAQATCETLDHAVQRFRDYMNQALGEVDWEASQQIATLVLMADPQYRDRFPGKLEHMLLARLPDPNNAKRKVNHNEFTEAKKAGLVLAPYTGEL